MMSPERKAWNGQQKVLRQALTKSEDHAAAIELFLQQHTPLHAPQIGESKYPSFAAEVWEDSDEALLRRIPRNGEHSAVWVMWHIARIEDVTMNMLVAGTPQLFTQENWRERLKIDLAHTGNAMDVDAVAALSAQIDIAALRAYRLVVGQHTQKIVKALPAEALNQKTDPARLQKVLDEDAVLPEAKGIIDYWSKRTIAGLLLMPPTRHNFLHLNEAMRIKSRKQ
jgi:hypothetical protein